MYTAKDYSSLLGLAGFSDTLLNNHFKLYQGYVTNTNKIIESLRSDKHAISSPEWNELTRRFGWEFNGMRLHELYFENMKNGGVALAQDGELGKVINHVWGSFENWKKDFLGIGALRGVGWVVLLFDPTSKMVFNVWVNEHDVGLLAGAIPLLVMDVFEHAYITDYGITRPDYMNAFMNAIDWSCAEMRLTKTL